MLIYIHVPFCKSKCHYCAFNSWVAELGETQVYLNGLLEEIEFWAPRMARKRVSTVFIGGGTPSTLPAAAIGAMLDRLASCFKLADDAEITTEANPQSGRDSSYYSDLLRAGVNRLSLGMQSMNDELLAMMNRPHTVSDATRAMHQAREAGFKNINLDLMWGLPGQRLRRWKEDLYHVTTQLKPEHISAYGLSIEPGTPFNAWNDAGKLSFCSERELGHMFVDGADILEEAGYMQYEISNFAKLGFQCKHNLGYWSGEDYLGFGPGAVSTIGGQRWTNPQKLAVYVEMIEKKVVPGSDYGELEQLSPQTRLMEMIMLSLRTQKGFNTATYRRLTGRDFFKENQPLFNALHARGLIRIRNKYLSLTRSGMLVSNTVMTHLFDGLPGIEANSGLMLESQAAQVSHTAQSGPAFSAKAASRDGVKM